MVYGDNNHITGNASNAYGVNNFVGNTPDVANKTVTGDVTNGNAFGSNNLVTANQATAVGQGNTASGINSVAIGAQTEAHGGSTVAIGFQAGKGSEVSQSWLGRNVAIGQDAGQNVNSGDSIAIGSGAGGNLSKISQEGTSDELKWPKIEDASFNHDGNQFGSWPNKKSLAMVERGMNKDQVRNLIGNPHFSEGMYGVREWDYVFNYKDGKETKQCQYKVMFDKNVNLGDTYDNPKGCVAFIVSTK